MYSKSFFSILPTEIIETILGYLTNHEANALGNAGCQELKAITDNFVIRRGKKFRK